MTNLLNFLATNGGWSDTDKLLVCVIIILIVTIIWTILIFVMYKMNERKNYYTNRTIIKGKKEVLKDIDEEETEEIDDGYVFEEEQEEPIEDEIESNEIEEDEEEYEDEEQYEDEDDEEEVEDEEYEEEEEEVVVPVKEETKTKTVVATKIEKEEKKTKKKEEPVYETYVKIRFENSDNKLIYVVPKGKTFKKGDIIQVRIDKDLVRTAEVVKGNYTKKKSKGFEYKIIELA